MKIAVLCNKENQASLKQILSQLENKHVHFTILNPDLPLEQQVIVDKLAIMDHTLLSAYEEKALRSLRKQCFDLLYFHPSQLSDKALLSRKISYFIARNQWSLKYQRINYVVMSLLISLTLLSMLLGLSKITSLLFSVAFIYVRQYCMHTGVALCLSASPSLLGQQDVRKSDLI